MAERLGLKVEVCDEEWGVGVPVEKYADILAKDKSHEIKAVFVTQNETATGVASDVAGVRKALDAAKHPALLMVDGVSSVGSLEMRMGDWGVDCCVSGSQKGFMLPTGLGILAVSQKALDANKNQNGRMNRCFFAFEDMIKTNDQGYFPYTPATQLIRGLRTSLDLLLGEGIDNVVARHHRLASGVRAGVHAWGLKLCAKEPKWYSDTVSAVLVPEGIDSNAVTKTAYYRYNTSLGLGLNKVAGKVFRIGHLGSFNEIMALQALAGVEMALMDAGIPIEAGSGVAAAQQHFRKSAPQIQLAKVA
jgi:alanine-glyoxylate transaminase/serine-glyoxylate transaminase/serine-pyruvate transaminase